MPTLTTPADLIAAGLAAPDQARTLETLAQSFRIRVTEPMQAPALAAQFIPTAAELTPHAQDLTDPIGDLPHSPTKGLTHRYPDRVILHSTQTCEVYCRFCFRRETVGEDGPLSPDALAQALDYIRQTPAIWEVILTGGDPLTLSPRRLQSLLQSLSDIPHVQIIRFHTRVPVVAPQRITKTLLAALKTRATLYMVLHVNQAEELTPAACKALESLATQGIPLLSQSVLLKGVNNSAQALTALFRALILNRVKPYYLHHCDLARGTSHFRTTIAEGQSLMAALRGQLSGICLPTYVLDLPGGHGKMPLLPSSARETAPGQYEITDYLNRAHSYSDPL